MLAWRVSPLGGPGDTGSGPPLVEHMYRRYNQRSDFCLSAIFSFEISERPDLRRVVVVGGFVLSLSGHRERAT